MRTMSNYLAILFSIMLFVFRLIVVFTAIFGIEFIVQPISIQYELFLLLVMIVSIILIVKNKMTGAIIFLISSLAYYRTRANKNSKDNTNK